MIVKLGFRSHALLNRSCIIRLGRSIALVIFLHGVGYTGRKPLRRLALTMFQSKGGEATLEVHIPIGSCDGLVIQLHHERKLLILIRSGTAYRLGYYQGANIRSWRGWIVFMIVKCSCCGHARLDCSRTVCLGRGIAAVLEFFHRVAGSSRDASGSLAFPMP